MNDIHGVGCLVIATTDMINILDTESFKILPDKYEVNKNLFNNTSYVREIWFFFFFCFNGLMVFNRLRR